MCKWKELAHYDRFIWIISLDMIIKCNKNNKDNQWRFYVVELKIKTFGNKIEIVENILLKTCQRLTVAINIYT